MLPRLSIIILFVFLFLFGRYLYGQRIKGAAIVGMNLSQVDGDEKYGYKKIGWNTGLSAIIPLKKNFSLTLETLYSQKGANQNAEANDSIYDGSGNYLFLYTGQYKLKLDYVEIPVLVHYTDKEFISAGLGFSYGRLVNVKEWEQDTLNKNTSLRSGTYDLGDYSVIADIIIRIHKKFPNLKFNIRYSYSMSKIRTRDFYNKDGDMWTRHQYNNVFSFRFIYVFNEKSKRLADPD